MNSRAKGISLSYLNMILNTIVGLFMSAFIIRKLGQTEYGVYQTMTSFLTYLVLFEFGTGTIMTRNISLCRKNGFDSEMRTNYTTISTITIFLSSLICLAAVCFYFFIDYIYSRTLTLEQIKYGKILFILMVCRTVFSFLLQSLNGALLGLEKYTFAEKVKLFYLLVRTFLVVIFVSISPLSIVIVIIDMLLTIVQFVFSLVYCHKKTGLKFSKSDFDMRIVKDIFPLALAMLLQTVVNMANGNVDKFVIGVLIAPEAVTVYSVGLFIYTIFSSMSTIPISMYMPQIAKDISKGITKDELTNALIRPCRLIVIIGGLILFGFFCVGRQFLTVVYGSGYEKAWIIALIIMVPMYINMSNGILINVLDVYKKRHIRSLCLLGTTILNIILTVWWIATWDMIGAAVATAISTIIGQIIAMNIYYYRCLNINVLKLFSKSFKGILLCLFVSACISFALTLFIDNNLFAMLLCGLVFCILFFVLMWLFGANQQEKDFARQLVKNHK